MNAWLKLTRKRGKYGKPSDIKDDIKLMMIKESAKHWWLEYSVTKPYDAMKQFW